MLEAVESSVNGFSHLQSCGDSSEEELSVLPRHTKVVVTGNNRTKSVLVGLQGVVKKAVGLGGWHWLPPPPARFYFYSPPPPSVPPAWFYFYSPPPPSPPHSPNHPRTAYSQPPPPTPKGRLNKY